MSEKPTPVVLGTLVLVELTVEFIRRGLDGETAANEANAAWVKLNALIATYDQVAPSPG